MGHILKLKMRNLNNIFKMNITDIKIYGLNLATFTISYTNVEFIIRFALVTISILYTLHKWYIMYKKDEKNK